MTVDRAKDSQRLFFALWPSDEFRVEVESATRALARESGGRVIPPENLHVTLLFLGRILSSQLQAVQQAGAACATTPAFELSFDRAETWGRANLLCLTTSSSPPAASQLAANLRQHLQREVPDSSEHEFRPHITLARDLHRRRRAEPVQPLRMKVNDFVLVDSRPGPNGSLYSVSMRWPLLSLRPTPNSAVADPE